MPTPITRVSGSTFMQADGTNFTTVGIDNSYKVGNGSIGAYAGLGMTFDGKPASAIVDLKGSANYGNSIFSGGFRVRNNIGEENQSVQFRIQPCTVNVPLGENIKAYVTPYAASKVNCNTGDITNSIGGYAGVQYNFKGGNVFYEYQVYDVTNPIAAKNRSHNIGLNLDLQKILSF